VKKTFFNIYDPVLYGLQWFGLHFFQGFTAGTLVLALYVGFVLVTAGWLVRLFGEERTVNFIQNHPGLFLLTVLLFTVGTGGVGYWCYTTEASELEANFKRRVFKHSGLFNAKAA
jgi:hypothetical protein